MRSSVRQDLMPIHIKHYHNIPQDDTFSRLLSRIEALEKQVEDLTKENAKHSVSIPKDENFLEKEDIYEKKKPPSTTQAAHLSISL